jgi:hypothetical protein
MKRLNLMAILIATSITSVLAYDSGIEQSKHDRNAMHEVSNSYMIQQNEIRNIEQRNQVRNNSQRNEMQRNDFNEVKQNILLNINARERNLNQVKNCIMNSKNHEELKSCKTKE